jgi:protein-tyrosine phosphatase
MIDLHSHVIPGVDDGARDVEEALAALRAMADEGVSGVVATPHFDGALTHDHRAMEARLAVIDEGWAKLERAAAGAAGLPKLVRGAEIKLDTPEPDVGEPRLRLAGGDFALFEFPFMSVPPHSARAVSWIRSSGYIPVIAHPERYQGIFRMLNVVEEWRSAGAYLQVNCGSLTGRYGPEAKRVAEELLERGWIDYLASDHHSRGPMPHKACREAIVGWGGAEQAELMMRTNPERLLRNDAPLPVAPLRPAGGLFSRIAKVFR